MTIDRKKLELMLEKGIISNGTLLEAARDPDNRIQLRAWVILNESVINRARRALESTARQSVERLNQDE